MRFEQINGEGHVLYLHHDQQGSTRLLTGATGAAEGTTTYDAFGNLIASTGAATTPLGYDGQYTDKDTGLIYLRARYYDPVTANFLSVDPALESTRSTYGYAQQDPLTNGDPSGRSVLSSSLEALHYVFDAVAIAGCVAQPEVCALAALADAIANTLDTAAQLGLGEKSDAAAITEEVATLVAGGLSVGSAHIWGKLTDWAAENGLLGHTGKAIAANARLLNSGAAQWGAVQAFLIHRALVEIQRREKQCKRT